MYIQLLPRFRRVNHHPQKVHVGEESIIRLQCALLEYNSEMYIHIQMHTDVHICTYVHMYLYSTAQLPSK